MVVTIRAAVPSDLPAVTAIYRDCVLTGTASYELVPPDADEMAARFRSVTDMGFPYLVASDADGPVLGYAYASPFRMRPAYRWLAEDSIYLRPDARGRGIGRALLRDLVARCTGLGFRQMAAVIGGASPASCALHAAEGFEMVGTLTGSGYKHGRWLDTVLMQRPLGEGNRTHPDESAYPGTRPGG